MKRVLIVSLLIAIMPLYVLFAADPAANIQEKKMVVSVDYSAISGANGIAITSNSLGVDGSSADPVKYKEFDTLEVLSFKSGQTETAGIALDVQVNNNEYYAKGPENCYISWKIFSNSYVDVILKADGPLVSSDQKSNANWQITVEGGDKSIGHLTSEQYDYSTAEISVFKSNPKLGGVAGSKKITITTESLWGKAFTTYSGKLIAIIRTV